MTTQPVGANTAVATSTVGDPNAAVDTSLPTDSLAADNLNTDGNLLPSQQGSDPWNSLSAYIQDQATQRQERTKQSQANAGTDPNVPVVTGDNTTGSKIITAAEHLLGTMYKWGGNGPGGVDCSGLVRYAYAAAGIQLPRVSFEQANAGQRVGIQGLRPGDLVAWDNSSRNNGADHIAIYLGNGWIIEAAHPGTAVRTRRLGKDEGAWGVRMGW